jgi:hypothetical protein
MELSAEGNPIPPASFLMIFERHKDMGSDSSPLAGETRLGTTDTTN